MHNIEDVMLRVHRRVASFNDSKTHAPQPVRAAFDVEPYGHARQWSEPDAAAYDPTVQNTQRKPPGRDLAKPGRQRRSVLCSVSVLPLSSMISAPAFGTASTQYLSVLHHLMAVNPSTGCSNCMCAHARDSLG